jgi:FAD/FMN-containing dehydrogenase
MDAAVTLHLAESPTDLDAFSRSLRGSVVRPGDEAYEADRLVWNVAHQGSPSVIVRAADAGDVAAAISFASRNDLEIAVRSGGHSLAGHSSGDGTMVIDLRDMRGIHIDPDQGMVWAGAGLTAGELTNALAAHGLAVPFGDTGSVGIGGITLGGGIGWLVRKHGLTVDSLVAVEMVTASGAVVTASATENAELFWALRGGGGNFGVVTRFRYRTHRLDGILGGAVFLPPTREVFRSLVPIAGSAPEELTTIGMVMPIPPVPFVPEEHHGKPALVLMFVFAGDPEAGQAAIAPFTQVATPYAVAAMPMPYPGIYELTAEGSQRHPSRTRSVFLDTFDEEAVETIVSAIEAAPPGSMVQLRVLGGAMARVPADATAFAHRSAAVQVVILSGFPEPGMEAAGTAWNESLFQALEPMASGVYVNFLEDEGEARIREAYPNGTYERLAAVKRRYDRYNIFHRNQNVRPA